MIYKFCAIGCFILFGTLAVSAQTSDCSDVTSLLSTKKVTEISNTEKQELIRCAYLFQYGLLSEQEKCQYDSAMLLAEDALTIWHYLDDTLNLANLLKYKGYFLGKLGQTNEGKNQILKAIELFESKNASYGIAGSQFNLALVYLYEGQIDSAVFFTQTAKSYWKSKGDLSRTMQHNNLLLHIATFHRADIDYKFLINENHTFSADAGMHWMDEMDFFYVVAQYYNSVNNAEQHQIFTRLYEGKLKQMRQMLDTNRYSRYDPRNCP